MASAGRSPLAVAAVGRSPKRHAAGRPPKPSKPAPLTSARAARRRPAGGREARHLLAVVRKVLRALDGGAAPVRAVEGRPRRSGARRHPVKVVSVERDGHRDVHRGGGGVEGGRGADDGIVIEQLRRRGAAASEGAARGERRRALPPQRAVARARGGGARGGARKPATVEGDQRAAARGAAERQVPARVRHLVHVREIAELEGAVAVVEPKLLAVQARARTGAAPAAAARRAPTTTTRRRRPPSAPRTTSTARTPRRRRRDGQRSGSSAAREHAASHAAEVGAGSTMPTRAAPAPAAQRVRAIVREVEADVGAERPAAVTGAVAAAARGARLGEGAGGGGFARILAPPLHRLGQLWRRALEVRAVDDAVDCRHRRAKAAARVGGSTEAEAAKALASHGDHKPARRRPVGGRDRRHRGRRVEGERHGGLVQVVFAAVDGEGEGGGERGGAVAVALVVEREVRPPRVEAPAAVARAEASPMPPRADASPARGRPRDATPSSGTCAGATQRAWVGERSESGVAAAAPKRHAPPPGAPPSRPPPSTVTVVPPCGARPPATRGARVTLWYRTAPPPT